MHKNVTIFLRVEIKIERVPFIVVDQNPGRFSPDLHDD